MQVTNTITIEGRQPGRGKGLFPTFQMPLPPEWTGTDDRAGRVTLRDFIARVVRAEVAAFRERQEQRTVIQALTAAQIAEGVAKGKVDSGGRPDEVQDLNDEAAVGAALQAFEDGLYFVFIDDQQKERLDEEIILRPEARVTFLRLVALAGG